MSLLPLASLALALAAPPVTVTVDAKDGDTVSGVRSFRVLAQGKSPVTQVEFYVNGDLRDNDTSTPYQFTLDTLNENDGALTVRFRAYTSSGDTGEKTLKLTVDNGLSKGAPFHTERATSLLQDGKFEDAATSARIALKVDPANVPAKTVLARANLSLNRLDLAQQYAEDVLKANAADLAMQDLYANVRVRQALGVNVKQGGDEAAARESIRTALESAIKARRVVLDAAVDAQPNTPENIVPYVDANLRAGRFAAAVNALRPAITADNRRADLADRLAYALVRTGDPEGALNALNVLAKYGQPDATSFTLRAVANVQLGRTEDADAALREALLFNEDNLTLRTAQAWIALRQGKTTVLAQRANDLARDLSQRAEIPYFQAAVANATRDFPAGNRFFRRAVLIEPANPSVYIERANESMGLLATMKPLPKGSDKVGPDGQPVMGPDGKPEKEPEATEEEKKAFNESRDRYLATAELYYRTALAARPESADALSGMVALSLLRGDAEKALSFGEAATKAAPRSAAAQYGLAGAYNLAARVAGKLAGADAAANNVRYTNLSQRAITEAAKLDPLALQGRIAPDGLALWKYLSGPGRDVVLAQPK